MENSKTDCKLKIPVLIKGLLGVLTFLILLFIIVYINNFSGNFSYKQSDWGDFGSYISGTIGTLLMFVNIIVLIFIALTVKNYTKVNQDNFLNYEEKLLDKNLKYTAYKQLSETISRTYNNLTNLTDNKPEVIQKRGREFTELRIYLHIFNKNNNFLFNNEIEKFGEKCDNVLGKYEKEPDKSLHDLTISVFDYLSKLQKLIS